MKFTSEVAFWYFLAHRVIERSSAGLTPVLASLNQRAAELSLPIHYAAPHATSWALLLQLLAVASPYRDAAGRRGFTMMLTGFDHVFAPSGFAETVLTRTLGNFEAPALPGRTHDETIVDTFLANGMRFIDETKVERAYDGVILQSCLSDRQMFGLGRRAVDSPQGIWVETVEEYGRRRPGFFRRLFTNPNKWLFN